LKTKNATKAQSHQDTRRKRIEYSAWRIAKKGLSKGRRYALCALRHALGTFVAGFSKVPFI